MQVPLQVPRTIPKSVGVGFDNGLTSLVPLRGHTSIMRYDAVEPRAAIKASFGAVAISRSSERAVFGPVGSSVELTVGQGCERSQLVPDRVWPYLAVKKLLRWYRQGRWRSPSVPRPGRPDAFTTALLGGSSPMSLKGNKCRPIVARTCRLGDLVSYAEHNLRPRYSPAVRQCC